MYLCEASICWHAFWLVYMLHMCGGVWRVHVYFYGECISLARSLALFPDSPRSMTWMVLSIESSSSNHGSRDGDNAFQLLAGRAAFFNISAHIISTSLQTRAPYFDILAHCLQRERERHSQPTRTGKDTTLHNTNIPKTAHSEFMHNELEFASNKWN